MCDIYVWWRQDIEMLSVLLALCEGNPPVTGAFLSDNSSDVNCFLCWKPEQAAELTIQLPVFWNAVTLMWRHCKGVGGRDGGSNNITLYAGLTSHILINGYIT